MQKLTRQDLYPLEHYAEIRVQFKSDVIAHKKNRQVHIGEHATLYFEDRLTIHYQIQEMLRVERIFESAAINDELEAYNPLIPDGTNLKATFMLEYDNPDQRRARLAELIGVEDRVWLCVAGHDRVFAVADEDMERSDADKTSAVHFLRFEFDNAMITDWRAGGELSIGIDHPAWLPKTVSVPDTAYRALLADFD